MHGVTESKIKTINDLHAGIEYSLRTTVKQAIKIGKLLSEIKAGCDHGDFGNLCGSKIKMGERTARRYMLVFRHADKTAKLADLQEAESVAKQIETAERQAQRDRMQKDITKRKQTGEKPEGWTRAHDYEFKKQTDYDASRKRAQAIIDEKEKSRPERPDPERIKGLLDSVKNEYKAFQTIKEATSGNENVIAIIEGVLDQLDSNGRRHEFCNTLIKYLKKKSIEYSRA